MQSSESTQNSTSAHDTHPTVEALSGFVNGRLEESRSHEIEAHLDQCPSCCQRLAEMGQNTDHFVDQLVVAARLEDASGSAVGGGASRPGNPAEGAALSSSSPSGQPPVQVGRFSIRGQIGHGGFGIVLRGYDPNLRREVAIKIPRLGSYLSAEMRDRFLREAQAAAVLDHPNIVPVYEATYDANVCYIAAAYCQGPDLARWLKQQNSELPVKTAARLVAQLASAVQHAHSRGVLHRDLKPSNVLLEPVSRGHSPPPEHFAYVPKISDFGLAKLVDDNADTTRSNMVMGTAGYMSPEQASGRARQIGPATDIYSLGAILYELLTGRQPIVGETELETIQRVQHEEPIPPARLRPKLPGDLETVCLTCLAKEPRRRYSSAEQLHDDLQRFLRGDAIRARRAGRVESCWRWCRRKPALASLSCCVAILLLSLVVGSLVSSLWLRAQQRATLAQLEETQKAQAESEKAKQQALDEGQAANRQLFAALVAEARGQRLGGRAGQKFEGRKALREAAELAHDLNLSAEDLLALRNELIAGMALTDVRLDKSWRGYPPGSTGTGIAFDAKIERYAKIDRDGQLVVRRMEDNQELTRIDINAPRSRSPAWCLMLRFSPDGNYLAARGESFAGDSPRTIPTRVWDLRAVDAPIVSLPPPPTKSGWDYDFSPDSRAFFAVGEDGAVRRYELQSGEQRQLLPPGRPSPILRIDPTGNRVAVFRHSSVQIHDLESGELIHSLAQTGRVETVAWDQAGTLLAVASGHQAHIWDATSGKQLATCDGHQNHVVNLDFTADATLLVSTSWVDTRIWEVATGGQILLVPRGNATTFSSDGRWLGMGGSGAGEGRYEVALPDGFRCSRETTDPYNRSLDISPDGRLLLANDYHQVWLWELSSGQLIGKLELFQGEPRVSEPRVSAWFHPSAKSLLTSSVAGLHLWPIQWQPRGGSAEDGANAAALAADQLKIGPPRRIPLKDPLTITSFLMSRDGRALISNGGETWVVDPDAPADTNPQQRFRHGGWCMAGSPDGRWLATSIQHGFETRIWDMRTGRRVLEEPGINALMEFSPDGQCLVISNPEEYQVRDVGTFRLRQRVPRSEKGSRTLSFSRDGRLLALAPTGAVAKLFDAHTMSELATFSHPGGDRVQQLRLSSDGGWLVTKTSAGALHFWDLRRVRRQLAEMRLDWQAPPLAAATEYAGRPIQLTVDLGEFRDIEKYTQQIDANPQDVDAHYRRGLARQQFQRWSDAQQDFERTIQLREDHLEAHLQLARLLRRKGSAPEAIATFTRCLELDAKLTEAYLQRGRLLRTKKEYSLALADFTKASELQPSSWESHRERGLTLLQQRKWQDAATALDRAVQLQPPAWDLAHALFLRSYARHRMGQYAESLADGEQALELDPENYYFHSSMAWGLAICPDEAFLDADRAAKLAQQSIALNPRNNEAWLALGVARYRQQQWRPARQALRESLNLHAGGNGFHWCFMAMSCWQEGEQAEARRWLAKATAWVLAHSASPELKKIHEEAAGLIVLDDESPPSTGP